MIEQKPGMCPTQQLFTGQYMPDIMMRAEKTCNYKGVANNVYCVLSYNQVLANKLSTLNALLQLLFSKTYGVDIIISIL